MQQKQLNAARLAKIKGYRTRHADDQNQWRASRLKCKERNHKQRQCSFAASLDVTAQ